MWKLKRMSLFFLISCMLSVLCGCGASGEQETVTENTNSGINADMETASEGRVLVAYFSRADENYGVGYIEKGNTAIIAEMIAEETGGELFHIERETPYPAVYDE